MLRLRDIMTRDVQALSAQSTLREAVELFAGRHVSGAPVLDGGRVVGVVSATDLLSFVASTPELPEIRPDGAERDEVDDEEQACWDDEGDPPAGYFTRLWADDRGDTAERFANPSAAVDPLAEHTVGEVMTREVYALPPWAPVHEAAERMRSGDVHRVLVTEDGVLRGVVTTMDLARALADRRVVSRVYVFDR